MRDDCDDCTYIICQLIVRASSSHSHTFTALKQGCISKTWKFLLIMLLMPQLGKFHKTSNVFFNAELKNVVNFLYRQ